MNRISLDTNRRIADHLIERIPGQVYDTYYRSIEELAQNAVDRKVQDIINNTFIQTADSVGLQRWEYFYKKKPNDMSDDEWRTLLILLNTTTREGPTGENILNLLRFFDPSATITAIKPYPLYAGTPSNGHAVITRGSSATDTIVTTYPWPSAGYGARVSINWVDSSGNLTIYIDQTIEFGLTLGADISGAYLEVTVIWPTGNPIPAGDTYTVIFSDASGLDDLPLSNFYNTSTNQFPTPEYVILDENTSYSTDNEFVAFNTAFLLYVTSILDIAKLSYRQLLRNLLDLVLPANVVFSLRFVTKPPVYWGVQDAALNNKIAVYDSDYDTLTQANINIPGQAGTTVSGLLAVSDTEYLVILTGAGGIPWASSIFLYNISTTAWLPLDYIGFGAWQLTDLHNGTVLIGVLNWSRVEYLLYDITTKTIVHKSLKTSLVAGIPTGIPTSASVIFTTATPAGDGVFLICDAAIPDTSPLRYKIYVMDVLTNTILHIVTLPLAPAPFSITAITREKFVVCYQGGTQYYVDFTTNTSVFTTISLLMSKYTQDQVVAADAYNIFFGLNNADGTYRVYKAAFGSTVAPVLFDDYAGISSLNGGCRLFIKGPDMIIATKFKRIIYIENYKSATPTVTEKYLDILTGSSYNTIPYGIL